MASNEYDYGDKCKYCGAKPYVAGPHHANTCERNQSSIDMSSNVKCKFCDAVPFVAGSHHKKDCKRHIVDFRFPQTFERGMSSSDFEKWEKRAEKEMDFKAQQIRNIDWWGGGGSNL